MGSITVGGGIHLTAPTAGNVHLSTTFPYLFQVSHLFVWFAKHLSLLLCSLETQMNRFLRDFFCYLLTQGLVRGRCLVACRFIDFGKILNLKKEWQNISNLEKSTSFISQQSLTQPTNF